MNIDEIRAEIPKAFGRWCTVSKIWLECKDVDTRDFEIEDYCKTAARILVDLAYEEGIVDGIVQVQNMNYDAVYDRGFKAGKAADFEAHCDAIEESRQKWFDSGFDAAAKDPKAWELNGLKIGDKYKVNGEIRGNVLGFLSYGNPNNEMLVACAFNNLDVDPIEKCEKVIPDTREKIKEELSTMLESSVTPKMYNFSESYEDLAEHFISRIEALEK